MAFANDKGGLTDIQRVADIVIGDEHPDAALLQVQDDLLDIVDRDRVDAGKGLIQQDEVRLGRQGAGDFDPAAFTA